MTILFHHQVSLKLQSRIIQMRELPHEFKKYKTAHTQQGCTYQLYHFGKMNLHWYVYIHVRLKT